MIPNFLMSNQCKICQNIMISCKIQQELEKKHIAVPMSS